ncbi:Magnesium and cobalt efflux protein corC -like protein [Granulibacter bethesdensis]|nr:Magnesium and cobalt efflux protein corC -like protein [Granulibacter bethesdensis]
MMTILVEFLIVLLLILLNGLFAMAELALVSARRARLSVMEQKGIPTATLARELAEDPHRFLPTVQVGITLVAILSGTFGGARIADHLARYLDMIPVLARFSNDIALLIVVVVITYLTMVLGELVPKQLALLGPEQVAVRVARPVAWLSKVTGPAVWLLGYSSSVVLSLFGLTRSSQPQVTEEELKALLAEGTQAGVLETEERAMIERVLRLADKPIRALMTPRNEIAWIDRSDTEADIIAAVKEAPHSRLVVCEGSIDNVVGVVQAKHILDRLLEGQPLSIGASLRQPMVVPDTVTALGALERLKSDTLGLALVMDEYGSFEGVVTAADVLKAIVGEAGDNTGTSSHTPDALPGTMVLDGMMAADELKSRLSLPELPAEGSYHTAAGLVLAILRRVPKTGDRIAFAGWTFEVLEMDGRRVARLRASRDTLAEG